MVSYLKSIDLISRNVLLLTCNYIVLGKVDANPHHEFYLIGWRFWHQ